MQYDVTVKWTSDCPLVVNVWWLDLQLQPRGELHMDTDPSPQQSSCFRVILLVDEFVFLWCNFVTFVL